MLNWRKVGDYAFFDDLDNERKAWEYLRRNSEYQEWWSAYEGLPRRSKGLAINRSLAKPWGLAALADPDDDNPVLEWDVDRGVQVIKRPNRKFLAKNPQYVALGFDLERDLSKQLKQAQQSLQDLADYRKTKPNKPSNRLKGSPDHLRVLDAIREGIKSKELVDFFEQERGLDGGGQDFVENRLREARKYAKGGYKRFMLA